MNSEAEIRVVPYDPSWPERFEEERAVLAEAIGDFLVGSVEHVGSTAVPGLAAKPVIDIMAGVESLAASRPAIAILEGLAYCYFPYRTEVMHWFCKPSPQSRTHHLHLVPLGSRTWVERIAFREILRKDSSTAAAYARLKKELAERYRCDREAYTDAKAPFISRTLRRRSRPGDSAEAK